MDFIRITFYSSFNSKIFHVPGYSFINTFPVTNRLILCLFLKFSIHNDMEKTYFTGGKEN